jgi:predicted Zn-ribbon and HTH transcriptional regulator
MGTIGSVNEKDSREEINKCPASDKMQSSKPITIVINKEYVTITIMLLSGKMLTINPYKITDITVQQFMKPHIQYDLIRDSEWSKLGGVPDIMYDRYVASINYVYNGEKIEPSSNIRNVICGVVRNNFSVELNDHSSTYNYNIKLLAAKCPISRNIITNPVVYRCCNISFEQEYVKDISVCPKCSSNKSKNIFYQNI